MAVRIRRIVIIDSHIVGFQDFLHSLMAEESNIEPMPTLKETVSSTNVLVHMFKPFLYDIFCCHNSLLVYAYKVSNNFRKDKRTIWEIEKG